MGADHDPYFFSDLFGQYLPEILEPAHPRAGKGGDKSEQPPDEGAGLHRMIKTGSRPGVVSARNNRTALGFYTNPVFK